MAALFLIRYSVYVNVGKNTVVSQFPGEAGTMFCTLAKALCF
jgi:hypothetical protein